MQTSPLWRPLVNKGASESSILCVGGSKLSKRAYVLVMKWSCRNTAALFYVKTHHKWLVCIISARVDSEHYVQNFTRVDHIRLFISKKIVANVFD